MIEGLKPYAEYKESGLPWLGQIPVSWETPRTKTRFRLSIEKSGMDHGKELLSVYTHIGVRPRKDLEERGNKASSTNDYWVVRRGDIIVNKLLAWMGAVGVSHYDGVTSPAYDILRPIQKLEPDFYHLLFRTKMYLQLFKSRSRGIMDMRLRLYFDELGQIPLICPPPDEQAAIVRFLDHANRKIDGFIRAKRKLIGLLNEQKQCIIHRAITRGLHPDVPLKHSNIPWLGDIPNHWEVRRVKQLTRILRGKFTHRPRNDPSLYDGDYPFIQTGSVARAKKFITDYKQTLNERGLAVSKLFPKGTLCMTIAANIGDVAILDFEACFPDSVVGFVPKSGMDRDFLYLVFLCLKEELLSDAPVNTQGNLSVNRIGVKWLPFPPLAEQQNIAHHVESETSAFITAIARTDREIALMQEYRTRLTADIVTGQTGRTRSRRQTARPAAH